MHPTNLRDGLRPRLYQARQQLGQQLGERGQEEDRQNSKDAGFNGHMVKPVDPQALLQMLSDLANARQSTAVR